MSRHGAGNRADRRCDGKRPAGLRPPVGGHDRGDDPRLDWRRVGRVAACRHHCRPCFARSGHGRGILQRLARRGCRDRGCRKGQSRAAASRGEADLAAVPRRRLHRREPVRTPLAPGGAGSRAVALGRAGPEEGVAGDVDPRPADACERRAAAGQPRRSARPIGGQAKSGCESGAALEPPRRRRYRQARGPRACRIDTRR